MKCSECIYCHCVGAGIGGGYKCRHPLIEKCAREYEMKNSKRMVKEYQHIGYKPIKTCLRYCPYKMMKEEEHGTD